MSGRGWSRPATLAWSLWAFAVAELAAFWILHVRVQRLSEAGEPAVIVAIVVFVLSFATVGSLVARRLPSNAVGWLMCGAALSFATAGLALSGVEALVQEGHKGLVSRSLAWSSTWLWPVGQGFAGIFLLLLFPNGQLPSRRWLPVLIAAAGSLALVVVHVATRPGALDLTEGLVLENPFGIDRGRVVLRLIGSIGMFGMAVGHAAAVLSVMVRFRTARGHHRQQVKWLLYGGAVLAVSIAGSLALDFFGASTVNVSNALITAGLAAVPLSMGAAILRHRLYDIDLIVNRTIVYGVLSAVIAGTYVGSVLLFRTILDPITGDNDLAIAASTLAVAALFGPARRRIQSFIDRRFYRSRYDAQRTLETFGRRLRDEVDLDVVGTHLMAAIAETVEPRHASLWLAQGAAR